MKALPHGGKVHGVEAVDDLLVVEAPEPEAQRHSVVSGDKFGTIAKAFDGDPNKSPVILEAREPMLGRPDMVSPGQRLRLPALDRRARPQV